MACIACNDVMAVIHRNKQNPYINQNTAPSTDLLNINRLHETHSAKLKAKQHFLIKHASDPAP